MGIGALLWAGAAVWWGRAYHVEDPRLALRVKQALLAVTFGVPFLIAGLFFTTSNYPEAVVRAAAPAPAAAVPATPPAPPPEPPAPDPAQRAAAMKSAQLAAVRKYPALGVAGTPFNRAFVAAVGRLQRTDAAYFEDEHWPLKLADEINEQLDPSPQPEPPPASGPGPARPQGGFHRD